MRMSITDELRKYASVSWNPWPEARDRLLQMCDRIDAEHISIVDQTRNKAWNEGFDDGYASVDNWLAQHEDAMAEHGWIRLPKDADGEVIHIGDKMENLREDFEPPFRHTFRVYGIQYREYNQECTLTEDGYPSIQYRASEVRHHHKPTLEDVLAEFALEIDPSADIAVTGAETIKKFAAKLQLKEPNE